MDQYGDRLQYTGNLLSDLQTNIENISTNYVIHFPTTDIDFESVSTIMYPLLRSLGDLTFSGWKLLAKIDTIKPRSKIVSDFLEELYRGSSNLENGKKLRSLFSHKK